VPASAGVSRLPVMADESPSEPVSESDPVLRPYLHAPADREAALVLGRVLVEQAEPVIKSVVLGTLGRRGVASSADAGDVEADVMLGLVARLQDLRRDPQAEPIANFKHYVAVASYHACYARLRARNPWRWRLRNRIRYALGHDPDLGIWEYGERRWVGGRREWRGRKPGEVSVTTLVGLCRTQTNRLPAGASAKVGRPELPPLLRALFLAAGSPLGLPDLVDAVSELTGSGETQVLSNVASDVMDRVEDGAPAVTTVLDQQRSLRLLWEEIMVLPLRQRRALLLNLRDETGSGAIELFPMTGVASIRKIADVLELDHTGFAELWPSLPLDDRDIAERLGLDRQQVINLRKSARARLARRTRTSSPSTSLSPNPRR
jgi:hypothetical protein